MLSRLSSGLLYVSEGIPYGFSSIAMVAFMRQQGVSLALIGTFVAALFLPWAFEWAWAPVIDLTTLHRLGGRKAWIVACTVMMIATLLIAATVDFTAHFQLLLAMFVNGRFGFEAALTSVAGLLLLTLLFVVIYVRDPQADPTPRPLVLRAESNCV